MYRKTFHSNSESVCFQSVYINVFLGVSLEGTNAGPDRGMVFYNGLPICDDDINTANVWDLDNGKVVCRMLGYSRATEVFHNSDFGGGYPAKGSQFAKSGFHCTGSENHILDCPHDQTVSKECCDNGVTCGNGGDIVGGVCA